ncbi:MAG: type II toxin-antitoxin system HicB family antitoxin [bacterium]
MRIFTYRTIIEPDEKNTFHGYVPALPGCHTWGKTIEETKRHLREAVRLYIATLLEDKQLIPQEKGFEFFETFSEKEVKAVSK